MKDFITVGFRKNKLLSFILKIKQFFFLRRCKKQFKKDLKNEIYFSKLRENNTRSNFNLKEYIIKEFI